MQDSPNSQDPNSQNGHQSPPPHRHKLGFVGQLAKQFIDSKLTRHVFLTQPRAVLKAQLQAQRDLKMADVFA